MRRTIPALAIAAALVGAAVLPAAAQTPEWAEWSDLEGSSRNYTGAMQLPGGFPEAMLETDSRGGSIGVISGASTWLSDDTPPGETYGSSRNEQYLNLRPRADSPTAPSTTTYTFEHPTPPGGWMFALGDIDADQVTITAKGPNGQVIDSSGLGFQGEFNYCDAAGSPSCSGGDLPSWDPATATLTGNDDAIDTEGASGWFEPTVPIKTLTFEFTMRSGFPVYQTWFATITRDISGIVTGPEECVSGSTVNLFGPDGTELASTEPEADGTYTFAGYTGADGYEVEMVPPITCMMDETAGPSGDESRTADIGTTDATDVDFALREIEPVEVNGTVTDDDGNPLADVTVTLTPDGGGPEITAVTDSDGYYVFDRVEPGTYTWDIEEPDGYSTVLEEPDGPLDVPVGTEDPIEDQNFVLQADPSVSGQVTAGGEPLDNVTVTITGPDGYEESTITDADGNYEFDRVPPGNYTITVESPPGYEVVGDGSQDESVADVDVENVDFELASPGDIGVEVRDSDGNPVAGVQGEIAGPGGETFETDEEGNFFLEDLEPGEYTLTVNPTEGCDFSGEAVRTVTITSSGESVTEEFELICDQPGDENGSGHENGSGGDGADGGRDGGGADELPDTGAPASAALTAIAGALIVAGLLAQSLRRAFQHA